MLSLSYLKEYIMVSIALSTVTCAFIQKTKGLIKPKSLIIWYSFFVNILFSIIFYTGDNVKRSEVDIKKLSPRRRYFI